MLTKKFFALLLLVTCAAPVFAMTDEKGGEPILVDSAKGLLKSAREKVGALNKAVEALEELQEADLTSASEAAKKDHKEAIAKAETALNTAKRELQEVLTATNSTMIPVDTVVKTNDENAVAYYATYPFRKLNAAYAKFGSQYPKVMGAVTGVLALGAIYAIFQQPINDAISGNNDDTVEVRF